jgi:hypothetical protein
VLALSVPFWLLGAAFENRSTGLPVNIPISAQMACCPLLAALILLHRDGRLPAVRAAVKDAVDPRTVPLRWHLTTFGLMPLVMVLSYGLLWLLGERPPGGIAWPAIPVLFLVFLAAALGEELGWMGYAYEPLARGRTALGASLLLGGLGRLARRPAAAGRAPADLDRLAVRRHGGPPGAHRLALPERGPPDGRGRPAAHHGQRERLRLPRLRLHYDPTVTGLVVVAGAALVVALWGRTLARFRFGDRPRPPSLG